MLELDKNNEFVKSVFDYIEGGDISAPVIIFRQLEKKHEILFIPTTHFKKTGFCDDRWIKSNLFSFLSDSQLILAGDSLDSVEILDLDFREIGTTWRHWGEIFAKWCNENGIEKPLIGRNKSASWKYMDFYMDIYTSQWIQDYEKWAKAVLEIITEKDKIFGHEYKPIDE